MYICVEHIAKVFSCPFMEMWKFQYLGAAKYISLALTMLYTCVSMQVVTPYQSECGVSVVYRERFFHNLHKIGEMNSTLSLCNNLLVQEFSRGYCYEE